MRIRTKVIFIIVVASCLAIVLVLIASQTILLGQFSNLENSYVTDTTQLTGNLLQTDIAGIQSSAANDLGMWDDTYTFIQGLNPGYIQANFANPLTLQSIGCQSALFITSSGQDYYNVSYDDAFQNLVPFPAALADEFISHPDLWNFTDATGSSEGVISVPGQSGEVLLFGAAPILPTNGSGQVMGAVVVFKNLNAGEVQSLQQRAGVPVTVFEVNATGSGYGFQTVSSNFVNGNNFYTQPVNSSTIFGYESIKDVFGNPALILRIEMPRNIWNSGILTTEYYAAISLASIFLVALTFFALLERTVISRLSGITMSVKDPEKIEKFVNKSNVDGTHKICDEKGNDEISTLASSINWMVSEIGGKNDKIQQSEKMAAIGQMVMMIGHDLRNPLTGIKNSVYILKKRFANVSDNDTKEIFDLMDYDVKYSNRIINDLLDYSRESPLEIAETPLGGIIKECIEAVEIPDNVVVINETGSGPTAFLDRTQIKRAFINTITNAVEAMPDGGTLKISSQISGDNIEVSFSDTGKGISESKMKKLWTPFSTTKAKGMGLGLAITKHAIDAHGGRILVKSEIGKGTTFTFMLPSKPPKGGVKQ